MRFGRYIVALSGVAIITTSGLCAEKILPVISGMEFTTGNVVQRVRVRAQSMGPGLCGVEFGLLGRQAGFLAPPFTWSEWTPIEPAIFNSTTVSLDFNSICDTGAIAQVKFVPLIGRALIGDWDGQCDWGGHVEHGGRLQISEPSRGEFLADYTAPSSGARTKKRMTINDDTNAITMPLFGFGYKGYVNSALTVIEISTDDICGEPPCRATVTCQFTSR